MFDFFKRSTQKVGTDLQQFGTFMESFHEPEYRFGLWVLYYANKVFNKYEPTDVGKMTKEVADTLPETIKAISTRSEKRYQVIYQGVLFIRAIKNLKEGN